MSDDETNKAEDEANKPDSDEAAPTTPRRRSDGRVRRFIMLLALALLLGGAFLIFQRLETGKAKTSKPISSPNAVAITTATAQQGSVGVFVNALGSVTPLQQKSAAKTYVA